MESIKESLRFAEDQGKVGPHVIAGWALQDVEDEGICFYDAVVHQMRLIHHNFLKTVPDGTISILEKIMSNLLLNTDMKMLKSKRHMMYGLGLWFESKKLGN